MNLFFSVQETPEDMADGWFRIDRLNIGGEQSNIHHGYEKNKPDFYMQ